MNSSPIKIAGYSITDQLYESSRTSVYRGKRESDQRSVIIKLLKREYPSLRDLVQFRHQYSIAQQLDVPGIVHPLGLEPYHNGLALILEDDAMIALSDAIGRQENREAAGIAVSKFLQIAIQLAQILEGLNQHQIIHKDIKPSNILIQPETQQIKLTDFSLASRLPQETQAVRSANRLEGTLAYIAPEQTGRVNWGIDHRTDLYSLGVTFYELLTGQLPFTATDPLGLIHCHIAQHPVSPEVVRPTLPVVLSKIVLKLIAKMPGERYQSASGLCHDLEICLAEWQTQGAICDFPLGQRDISRRLMVPEKLDGPTSEADTLLATSTHVAASLDLTSIMKAAQAIAEAGQLEQLITTLMRVVLENAGAETAVLLLTQEDPGQTWVVEAISRQSSESNNELSHGLSHDSINGLSNDLNTDLSANLSTEIHSVPLAGSQAVPEAVINTVIQTQSNWIIDDASAEPRLAADPYICQHQSKSILCQPILYQAKLIGILYLENNLVTGAFTSDRVEILQFLCTQAAIAIKNARLYDQLTAYSQNLEQQVKAQTQQIHQNEATLRLFVEHTPAAVAMFDRDMRYILASRRWKIDFALEDQEIIGRCHYEVLPTIPENWKQVHQRCLAGAIERCDEDSIILEDGSVVWYQWEVHPWYTDASEIGGIIIFTQLITERKLAEIALQTSEERWQLVIQGNNDGIWDWNILTGEVFYSTQCKVMLGYEDHEFQNSFETWSSHVHPEDLDRVMAAAQAYLDRQIPRYEVEYRLRCKDGTYKWILGRAQALWNEQGQPVRAVGSHSDITDRKRIEAERNQAEAALRASEAELRHLFNCMQDYIFVLNGEGRYLKAAPTRIDSVGKVNQTLHQHLPQDIADYFLTVIQTVLSTQQPTQIEYCLLLQGQEHWFSTNVSALDSESVLWVARDITEHKQIDAERQRAEAALRASEEINRAIVQAMPDLIVHVSKDGYCLGYSGGSNVDILHSTEGQSVYDLLPSEIAAQQRHCIQQAIETRELQVLEQQFTVNGITHYEEVRIVPYRDQDALLIVRNIADRKRAEAFLRQSEEKQRALISALPDLIMRVNREGTYLDFVATKTFKVIGQTGDFIGTKVHESLPPHLAERRMDAVRTALQTGTIQIYEQELAVEGETQTEEVRVVAFGENEALLLVRDISERKRAEEQLRRNEAALAEAQRVAHIGNWEFDIQTQVITWSDELYRMFGLDPSQPVPPYVEYLEKIHPEDRPILLQCVEQAISNGTPYIIDYRAILPDGSLRHHEGRGEVTQDGQGRVVKLYGTALDITNRKQTEESLKKSEERWQLAIGATNDGIWDWDVRTNQVFWSTQLKTMLGYEEGEIESSYEAWQSRVHPEDLDQIVRMNQAYLNQQIPSCTHEYRLRYKDGTYKWVLDRMQAIWDEQGNPIRVVGAQADITDRKLYELTLQSLVEGTASVTGEDFFRVLAKQLALALDVSHVFASRRVADRLETLVIYGDGQFQPQITYPIQHAPCERTIEQGSYCCSSQVQSHFPLDPELFHLGVESYLGYALKNTVGETIGVLCILDRKPIVNLQRAEAIVRVFGGRAAAELERLQVLEALQELNSQLEQRVQKRTQALLQSQQALQQSEHDLRTIFNNVYDAIFIHDAEGRLFHVNDRMLELYQVPRDQALSFSIADYSAAFQQRGGQIPEMLQRVIAGEQLRFEWTACRPLDNTTFEVEIGLRKITFENKQVILASVRDISDRKQAEAALRDNEERLRLALTAANQGLYDLDLQTGKAIVTPEYATMLGYDPAEFQETNAKWIERLHPDDAERVAGVYQAYVQGKLPDYMVEFRQRTKAGDWKWILSLGKIVAWSEEGQPLRMLGTHTDLDDRKRAEEVIQRANAELELRVEVRTAELKEAKEAAEAANRAKGEFLANVSHELRTPLNGILGYAQILQGSNRLSDRDKEGVAVIYRCGSHLLTLIDDILDFAKIEAQKLELYPSELYFSSFLQDLVDICRIRAEQKGILFTYQLLSVLPAMVYVDGKRLRQVLLNLLGNAIKFTDKGRVSFTVEIIESEAAPSSAYLSGSYNMGSPILLRFEVEDTGIGIHPDQLAKILLPFEQAGDGAYKAEGTGLGLAITSNLLALMNSKLQIQSQPGQGSRFWFEVQLQIAPSTIEIQPTPSPKVVGFKGRSRSILVVEDQRENRLMLIDLLKPLGFAMIEAKDGVDGLDKAIALRPDLIIVDLEMPAMDGWMMIQQLQQANQEADQEDSMITIASSARVAEGDRQKSLAAGAHDFLAKPIQVDLLLNLLQVHLKLEWIYDQGGERRQEPRAAAGETKPILVAPPLDVLDRLFDLARRGNIPRLITAIETLKQADPQFVAFATQLRSLADNFQIRKIQAFIDSFRSKEL